MKVKAESNKLPLAVLISGGGSNLQAIIDSAEQGLPVDIRAVISSRGGAFGLERAEKAGIETRVLDHTPFADRETYDRALIKLIDGFAPVLVILAGFMRILSPVFVHHYRGYLLNIHPSLLPKYPGLHTHQRVLEAGDSLHGATVHFVTEELDGGPLIIQARVPVKPDDEEETLAARVLTQEHIIYPRAIRWFAEGRISMDGNRILMDGRPLDGPIVLD